MTVVSRIRKPSQETLQCPRVVVGKSHRGVEPWQSRLTALAQEPLTRLSQRGWALFYPLWLIMM